MALPPGSLGGRREEKSLSPSLRFLLDFTARKNLFICFFFFNVICFLPPLQPHPLLFPWFNSLFVWVDFSFLLFSSRVSRAFFFFFPACVVYTSSRRSFLSLLSLSSVAKVVTFFSFFFCLLPSIKHSRLLDFSFFFFYYALWLFLSFCQLSSLLECILQLKQGKSRTTTEDTY